MYIPPTSLLLALVFNFQSSFSNAQAPGMNNLRARLAEIDEEYELYARQLSGIDGEDDFDVDVQARGYGELQRRAYELDCSGNQNGHYNCVKFCACIGSTLTCDLKARAKWCRVHGCFCANDANKPEEQSTGGGAGGGAGGGTGDGTGGGTGDGTGGGTGSGTGQKGQGDPMGPGGRSILNPTKEDATLTGSHSGDRQQRVQAVGHPMAHRNGQQQRGRQSPVY